VSKAAASARDGLCMSFSFGESGIFVPERPT